MSEYPNGMTEFFYLKTIPYIKGVTSLFKDFRLRFKFMDSEIENYVKIMMEGKGYFTLPQAFSQDEIKKARDLIMMLSDQDKPKVTHFHGSHEDKVSLQRRVWNLINKGEVFQKMVQHPKVVEIASAFLGDEFILGSIAANRLLPGGPGQEPHIDYPYWDYYNKKSFPGRGSSLLRIYTIF